MKTFTPEFRNRLDAIVPFSNLKPTTMERVVDKFVSQLEAQLADRNVTISLSDSAREYLAETGYDPAMGARPLGRVIQEKVKRPLAEEILFGKLEKGGIVDVDFKKGELTFKFEASPPTSDEQAPEAEEDTTETVKR
jgi:ATP-dependent Clp protease ATP-binding subunit ClpA